MILTYYRGAVEDVLVRVNKVVGYSSYYRKDMQSILFYCSHMKIKAHNYFPLESTIP